MGDPKNEITRNRGRGHKEGTYSGFNRKLKSIIIRTFAVIGVLWYLFYFCPFVISAQINSYRKTARHGSLPVLKLTEKGNCLAERSPLARLEPPEENVFVGTTLDWSISSPREFENMGLEDPLTVYGAEYKFRSNGSGWAKEKFMGYIYEIAEAGSILYLKADIDNMYESENFGVYGEIAETFSEANHDLGIPVILSWGPSMNSTYKSYGMKPKEYVESFRAMSDELRKRTNLTVLMWEPEFTNNGGQNYDEYWPGDKYVDWIGIKQILGSGDRMSYLSVSKILSNPNGIYKKYADRGYGRTFPVALTDTTVVKSGHSLESTLLLWAQYVSNEIILLHPKVKLIMFPSAYHKGDANDYPFANFLKELVTRMGGDVKRIIMGGRSEITFLCSGMVNCRTINRTPIFDDFVRAIMFLVGITNY